MKLFRKLRPFDRLMAAVSFAEANEAETALRIMEEARGARKRRHVRKAPENRKEDNRPRLQI